MLTIAVSGINGFIYYAPILFTSLGLDNEMSLIVSGILNIWQLVAICVCFFIVDRVGRRPLAIFGGFASMIPYIVMAALVGKYSSDWSGHPAAGWTCIAMACEYSSTLGVTNTNDLFSCLHYHIRSVVCPSWLGIAPRGIHKRNKG